ncbi:hypothetical protein G6F24_015992 [Rhizopus arrhizus]|nr:hypothetical protein G6F24_015992 [Rhizopus arrhizus]
MEWFFDTLRKYPELAIFLTLGLGRSNGYFAGGRTGRSTRHHHRPDSEAGVLPALPLRSWLRCRTAILPRHEKRWPPPGYLRGHHLRDLLAGHLGHRRGLRL